MVLVEFETPIKGEVRKIKIETDPTWGEFEQIIQKSTGAGSSYAFFEELTRSVIKDGLPFDSKNLTEWKMLPISEMTALVGKVMKAFPLGNYLDNLGMMDNPLFKAFLQ